MKMLVDAGVDINWQDHTGETALHVAARFGHTECAKILLQGTDEQKADLELAEKSFAWTPLHIAAVDGHLPVARLLVEAGADVTKMDSSGWTAKEHAALRGHLPIARLLLELAPAIAPAAAVLEGAPSSLEDRRSNATSRLTEPQPVKTYGHRYLKDETLVLVSLGVDGHAQEHGSGQARASAAGRGSPHAVGYGPCLSWCRRAVRRASRP